MTRSLTTKAARRSFRGHVTPPVVETVRDRWLRKHRRQFEKYGFTDPAAQSRIVAAWAASGYFDIDPAVFTELGGEAYFKPKAQITVGVDANTWVEDLFENGEVFYRLPGGQS